MNKEYKYKIIKFADRYQMTINNMTLYDVDEYIVRIIKQIEKENANLRQALNEIREYVNSEKLFIKMDEPQISISGVTKYELVKDDILQIIDKV